MKKKFRDQDYTEILADRIIFEDEFLAVVDKPAGVLSQPDDSGTPAIAQLLGQAWQKRGRKVDFLAPVHRLDRNTSGLILLAKTPWAAQVLGDALHAREIKRTYWALVKGDPGESGRIEAPLKKDINTNEVFVDEEGDYAATNFRRLGFHGACASVEVELETGRSHQIRVHFSYSKHALIGDRKYAKKPWSELFHRPALHAQRMVFAHPKSGDNIFCEAPLPEDLLELLARFE